MWVKPTLMACVTDAVAVEALYCQVPVATAGIFTPLLSVIKGVGS